MVAGDVDPDAIAARLDARLAGWSGPRPHVPEISTPPDSPTARGSSCSTAPVRAQAVVRVGPRRDCTGSTPTTRTCWSSTRSSAASSRSRLNAKLREEKGFTYGVRSHFDFRRGRRPVLVSASLQSDRLAEALDDLRHEVVALLGDRPPTAAELDDARRSLIEGQARHFETPSALVSRYAGLFLHGLPPDHHARFADRLEAVSLDSLQDAATRRIDPRSLVVVVVADASKVVEPLGKLGWAELTVLPE